MSERVGSLVVAVPAPPDHLAGTIKPLKYPYADADKFQEYVRNAWPHSAPAWHVRLPNGSTAATLTAIRGAVAQLARYHRAYRGEEHVIRFAAIGAIGEVRLHAGHHIVVAGCVAVIVMAMAAEDRVFVGDLRAVRQVLAD